MTPRGHYKQIYYDAIGAFIVAVGEKFEQDSFEYYAKMENLLLTSINGKASSEGLRFVKRTCQ